MTRPLIVAIDPDTRGWIVIGDRCGVTHAGPLAEWLDAVPHWSAPAGSVAFVESIPYIPGKGQIAARVQGEIRGRAIQAVASGGCRVVEVSPRTWQIACGVALPTSMRGVARHRRRAMLKTRVLEFAARVGQSEGWIVNRHSADAYALWWYVVRAARVEGIGHERG